MFHKSGIIGETLTYLDKTLEIHNESEWSGGGSEYSAFNDAGVECEVGEFLYAMARILKPRRVLETGTHWGIGAAYLGYAVKENGVGMVDTFEFLTENFTKATDRLQKLELLDVVIPHLMDVADFVPSERYQLMFLDTEPQTRFAEMARFCDHLDEGGYLFIHDLHRHMHQIPNQEHGFAWPFGPIPKVIRDKVASGELRPFHFPTPRGFTGFYRVAEDDYKW